MAATTGVRAFFIVLILILFFNIILNLKQISLSILFKNLYKLLFVSTTILLIIYILGFMDVMLDRFLNSDNGRFNIWIIYLKLFNSNILGLGIPFESIIDTSHLIYSQYGVRLTAHNFLTS